MSRLYVILIFITLALHLSFGQTATTTVNPTITVNNNTKPLLGITFDSRTGMNGYSGYLGYFTPSGTLIPNIDTLFGDFPMNGLRYPANAISLGFQWKKSIGLTPRPFQNILGSAGPSQSMDFGFDEFMAYCESKGLSGEDIQIMVPIYDSAVTYLQPTQNIARVPFPSQSAADWVEYANCPATTNWGGGVAWGAIRSANGHPLPYNIKTWNIGNEPWAPSEMNFDTTQYFPIAKPIIDSMLARNPTIHITIPTVGQANSNWNRMIRNFKRTFGQIYGISPHFFSNGLEVANIETALKTIVDSSNTAGLKTIVGDFSHEIPNGNSTLDKNRAMSWKGVNFTLDMLLMFSQLNTIERANHWTFGMPTAVWRPIRKEINGIYTLLPVGEFYKIITPFFSQKSLTTISTSPVASDGHPYSLRASAFANATNDTISVVAINRDPANTLTYSISGFSSLNLFDAKILTSDSLTGEVIFTNAISPNINGHYILTPSSILLLKYSSTITGVANTNVDNNNFNINIYPNPFNPSTTIHFSLPKHEHVTLKVYDLLGREVATLVNETKEPGVYEVSFDASGHVGISSGVYYYRLMAGGFVETKKIILMK